MAAADGADAATVTLGSELAGELGGVGDPGIPAFSQVGQEAVEVLDVGIGAGEELLDSGSLAGAADGLVVQTQDPNDLGVGLSLVEQGMNGGVMLASVRYQPL
ncbi:hypothetical protein ABZV14_16855 [Streptosporangium canum]|uniref:hypothetical protein n=1 Tax=Streptosporangium canum TaxID=324952 RepID=UPI0033A7DA4A